MYGRTGLEEATESKEYRPKVFKETVRERKQPTPERCRSLRAVRRICKSFLEKEFRMQGDAY